MDGLEALIVKLRDEWKPLALITGVFLVFLWLPVGSKRFDQSVLEALTLAKWYAREHVLLCLVPAFFIAGAISVFVSQAAVIKYLGAQANKLLAYAVAAVSGTILAVCSCTVLPLFAGIYKRGAGLGPATAFLYSGPAINVLAIILTARILGLELGVARAVGAVVFSIVIGLLMAFIFRKEENERASAAMAVPEPEVTRALWKNALYFTTMVAILVFANWAKPAVQGGAWHALYSSKWILTGLFSVVLAVILVLWFAVKWWHALLAGIPILVLVAVAPYGPMIPFAAGVLGLTIIANAAGGETREWLDSSWGLAKQIIPLLFAGVLVAGLLLGGPGGEGLLPSDFVTKLVGGNSVRANFFAALAGALMYFATLTEVPILKGLMESGMGKGPALALLLAGPALSLPNMLVIRSIMGTKKTLVFVALVVVMATASGTIFGALVG